MTCQIFYQSKYIEGCNISKFGEGCETCIPLFKNDFIILIILIASCTLILTLILFLLEKYSKSFKKEMKKNKIRNL